MKLLLTITAAFLLASTGRGQLIASFTGGDDLNVGPGTAGFSFDTGLVAPVVNELGVWASSGTLFSAHLVGLWDATTHVLLASALVPGSASALNGFAYTTIMPLTLLPSHAYVLGAQYADNDFDMARGDATSLAATGGIVVRDALLSNGSGFEFPGLVLNSVNLGFFGPNAVFATVPEPYSAVALGFLLLLGALTTQSARALPIGKVNGRAASPPGDLVHAKRRQPLVETQAPATNRPPVTPGNTNGQRPIVPPGLDKQNYAAP